jgi:hypothetical protein
VKIAWRHLRYAAMPSVNMVADLISNQTYHRKV